MSTFVPGLSARSMAIWSFALLAGISLAPIARAQEGAGPTPMRRVEFQVERSREVPNDLLTALLRVTHDDVDTARLADRVNDDMRFATNFAKESAGVEVESGAYYTSPIRDRERITGWTASQELVLRGRDTAALTRLIAKLQERLQLASLQFSVSTERRRKVEEELIAEALAAYSRRAELIRTQLGAASHELVYLSVNSSGLPPPGPIPMAERSYAASARVSEPSLEAGTSAVSVTVAATIELR